MPTATDSGAVFAIRAGQRGSAVGGRPYAGAVSLEAVVTDPAVRLRGLTRVQYDALVDTGVLEGEHVELLEGALVEVTPQGDDHDEVVEELNRYLTRRVEDPWRVRPQLPLVASEVSEPEPDVAVAQRLGRGKPRTAALVIEVAVTSQRIDLVHKPAVYGSAGVEQYWVIDVPAREVVVHTSPRAGGYDVVERRPWTTQLQVLGVPVDLAALLHWLA